MEIASTRSLSGPQPHRQPLNKQFPYNESKEQSYTENYTLANGIAETRHRKFEYVNRWCATLQDILFLDFSFFFSKAV